MKNLESKPALPPPPPPPPPPPSGTETGTDSPPPLRERYQPDPLTRAESDAASESVTPTLKNYLSNAPDSFGFREVIFVKRGEAVSDPTPYLFDLSSLGTNTLKNFIDGLDELKLTTKTSSNSLCIKVTPSDPVNFPYIKNGEKCADVDSIIKRETTKILLSGVYVRNGLDVGQSFDITAEVLLKDRSDPDSNFLESPVKHKFEIRSEDPDKCLGGLVECESSRWWITTLLAIVAIILTAITVYFAWKQRSENRSNGETAGAANRDTVQQSDASVVILPDPSADGDQISPIWFEQKALNFNGGNTQALETILKVAYHDNGVLRRLSNSAGLIVGEIFWNEPDDHLAQPILERAAEEGKLVNLIVTMLRDQSIVGSHNSIRALLNDEAEAIIMRELRR